MSLLLALSVAVAAPEGVPVTDADVWEARWPAIVEGPAGCWEVTGRATWTWDAGRMGSNRGNASFVGILEDGLWKDVVIRSLGEDATERGEATVHVFPHGKARFVPLVGKFDAALIQREDVGDNVIMGVVDELGGEVLTSWSDWDDKREAAVLHREIPLRAGGRATMEVLFPDGQDLPTRMDLDFGSSFTLPDKRMVRVRDAEAHVRGRAVGGMVFPEAEAFTFSASVLGFRGFGAQTLRYEAFRPCGGAAESGPEDITGH